METCKELQAAVDQTKTKNVVIEMHPLQAIDCGDFTTMTLGSNDLTVESTDDPDDYDGNSNLYEVRFEVTNGAKLTWEPNVEFNGPYGEDVDGGGLFVGEGSSVRFMNDLLMTDVGVKSVTDEGSDYASVTRSGGCVYTDGALRVDGDTTFTRCEVAGGGESSPGPGGGIYVGKEGSVELNGAVEMSSISITDDEGGNGGGIYNAGEVTIKGSTKFESVKGSQGGAIYNAAGSEFEFTNQATAVFIDCVANDGTGGSLYNKGYLKFSGQAVFLEIDAPAIYISSTGETVLSDNSVFRNDDTNSPAVYVASGGELDIRGDVLFIADVENDCSSVYFKEDKSCLE